MMEEIGAIDCQSVQQQRPRRASFHSARVVKRIVGTVGNSRGGKA